MTQAKSVSNPAPQQTTLRIGGRDVTCHIAGKPVPGRDPIVLIHGTSGRVLTHFGFLFPMLAVNNHVIGVDWADPGRDAPLELEDLEAQILGAVADLLPGQKITLVGYSLGAVLAAFIAARHPGLVRDLVLVAGWMKTDLQQRLRNNVWQALYATQSPEIRDFTVFCATGAPFLAARTAADMAPALAGVTVDDFVAAQMDLNRRIDISALVPQIRARTLVVGCTHDNMVPRHHSKALFGAIEDARYTEIAAGHGVVFERAPELMRQIEIFAQAPGHYPAGSIIPALKA